MLSRVFTSGPTGSAECQVLSPTAKAYPLLGENGILITFGMLPSGCRSWKIVPMWFVVSSGGR